VPCHCGRISPHLLQPEVSIGFLRSYGTSRRAVLSR